MLVEGKTTYKMQHGTYTQDAARYVHTRCSTVRTHKMQHGTYIYSITSLCSGCRIIFRLSNTTFTKVCLVSWWFTSPVRTIQPCHITQQIVTGYWSTFFWLPEWLYGGQISKPSDPFTLFQASATRCPHSRKRRLRNLSRVVPRTLWCTMNGSSAESTLQGRAQVPPTSSQPQCGTWAVRWVCWASS